MAYVAIKPLRWGDRTIEPGDPVPEQEEGRNYASLLRSGHIAEVKATQEMSDEELAAHAEELQTQLDAAHERIGELEAGQGESPTPVEIPDEVTPGLTAGWPLDATTGKPLALSHEQRAELAEKQILPEGTEAEPVSAIVTHHGELVVVSAPEVSAEAATEDTEDPPSEETAKPETAQPAADEKEKESAPKAKAAGKGNRSKAAAKPKAKAAGKGK